jgi:hypothetical protein
VRDGRGDAHNIALHLTDLLPFLPQATTQDTRKPGSAQQARNDASRATLRGGLRRWPGVIRSVVAPGGNHASIAPLLDADFPPRWCDAFFASAPIGRWESYLFHDMDLL